MTDDAAEIKRYFVSKKRESPESTRRSYTAGKNFDEVFEKAAENCTKCKATVVDYVDAHFNNKDSNLVHPQFLASTGSIKVYNEYMSQFKVSYAELFDLFAAKLKRQIELGRDVEWILNCVDFDFPAWFRICITKEPIQSVIDNYQQVARDEYTLTLRDFLLSKDLEYRRIINEV